MKVWKGSRGERIFLQGQSQDKDMVFANFVNILYSIRAIGPLCMCHSHSNKLLMRYKGHIAALL